MPSLVDFDAVSACVDLNCWFPFGVESEAEEASAAGGLLHVSEVQVFAFWHRIRDRALAFVSTSSTAFTDELMNLILKTVAEGSHTAAVGWNTPPRRAPPDAASGGRFEHPSGEIEIDLQTGEVFFTAGAGMKMPAEIAQAPGKIAYYSMRMVAAVVFCYCFYVYFVIRRD